MRELNEQEINLVAGGPVAAVSPAALPAVIGQFNVSSSTTPSILPGLFPTIPGVHLLNVPLTIAK